MEQAHKWYALMPASHQLDQLGKQLTRQSFRVMNCDHDLLDLPLFYVIMQNLEVVIEQPRSFASRGGQVVVLFVICGSRRRGSYNQILQSGFEVRC